MAKILNIAVALVPGVALNQLKNGFSFRFTPQRAQSLVDMLDKLSQDIADMANNAEVPEPAPVPIIQQSPQHPRQTLTQTTVQAEALRLAADAMHRGVQMQGAQQPTTVRPGSREAQAMKNARPPSQTPIVLRRKTPMRPANVPIEPIAEEAIPLVTVTNPAPELPAPRVRSVVGEGGVPVVVREGFEPNGTDELGPPPDTIAGG